MNKRCNTIPAMNQSKSISTTFLEQDLRYIKLMTQLEIPILHIGCNMYTGNVVQANNMDEEIIASTNYSIARIERSFSLDLLKSLK